jgi:integrating conjugative element relaxase (TIGR03760 family)
MLKSLLKYLPVSLVKVGSGEKTAAMQSLSVQVSDGYHAPVLAREQLVTPRREQLLQMLWDYSSLPKGMYQQYYLRPLEHCVTLMQQLPATQSDHHSYLGGMVDHLLETVAYAARLSKNYLLPVGAQPEEQASQSAAWNAVIVYAAMLQSLDRLCQIEIELESGQRWMLLNAMPSEPYRFRFKPVTDAMQAQSLSAMLAWKIIPDEALLWLGTWPEVLKTLSLYLTGFRNESGIVHTIVEEAIRASIGKSASVVADTTVTPILSDVLSTSSAEHTAPASLATSLDSAVTLNIAPVEEDVTGDLLTVLGFSEPIDLIANKDKTSTQSASIESRVKFLETGQVNVGKTFYQWLNKCLLEQSIMANEADSPVHIIVGYVFVRSPKIFYQFIAESRTALAEESHDWRVIQKQFEKLKIHKRQSNGTNVYRCQEKETGKSFNGYLIPTAKIYGNVPPPADSPSMIISQ